MRRRDKGQVLRVRRRVIKHMVVRPNQPSSASEGKPVPAMRGRKDRETERTKLRRSCSRGALVQRSAHSLKNISLTRRQYRESATAGMAHPATSLRSGRSRVARSDGLDGGRLRRSPTDYISLPISSRRSIPESRARNRRALESYVQAWTEGKTLRNSFAPHMRKECAPCLPRDRESYCH